MKKLIAVLLALLFCTSALAEGTGMKYDFSAFTNVTLTGIDLSTLNEDELSALYQAARYCQAMTEADIDTMREIVSEDMKFVHMSGMTQTREEYFADVADGSLTYYAIGMENPAVAVDGDKATVTYTSALTANAYGAQGAFRMKGTHYYRKIDGEWIAVKRMLMTFINNASLGAYRQWIEDGRQMPLEDVIEMTNCLVLGGVRSFFK